MLCSSYTCKPILHNMYILDGQQLNSCSCQKDFGIMMSDDLSRSNHLTHITNKSYKKLGLLRRSLCYNNSTSTKKRLYVYHSLDLNSSTALKFGTHIYVKMLNSLKTFNDVLNDYSSDYKSLLLKLNLLPLTML